MDHCETCGKLIQQGEGQCYACRRNPESRPERARDMTTPVVARPVDAREVPATAEDDVYRKEPCVRCRKHAAMVDSDFCLSCQLELLSLLGEAAHELFQTPAPPPKPPVSSSVSLMNDVDGKRDRTATSRIRVVGGAKLK